jgi:hypothetical protein
MSVLLHSFHSFLNLFSFDILFNNWIIICNNKHKIVFFFFFFNLIYIYIIYIFSKDKLFTILTIYRHVTQHLGISPSQSRKLALKDIKVI